MHSTKTKASDPRKQGKINKHYTAPKQSKSKQQWHLLGQSRAATLIVTLNKSQRTRGPFGQVPMCLVGPPLSPTTSIIHVHNRLLRWVGLLSCRSGIFLLLLLCYTDSRLIDLVWFVD